MNILDTIIARKKEEVAEKKALYPEKLLEKSLFFGSPVVSMKKYVRDPEKTGIIAEFKRKSPSKGWINPSASVEKTTIGYMQAGASALSVLTDCTFFGGSEEDLKQARKFNYCPLLRKDFMVDEYQLIESRSLGADCILLIAAALSAQEIRKLAAFAKDLGMEVLLEVHNREELDASLNEYVDLVGVNNRNLKTFEVSVETSLELIKRIPESYVRISESGLSEPATLVQLKQAGFDGFLIGENFMKTIRPHQAAYNFMNHYRKLLKPVTEAKNP
ncbi:indole-3-glycerol phosphate synthase [Cyclobacterium xiamenense]|uniref:indole-3-glycerol-phosphate synthase n=1 Tax=Cyclobacterium xiamenense TaxID=1297121 RepID=A0A1H6Z0G0_9BACT|nr:indole-3-glycerol phosphate synthase TrpC [Cyclobacterium xiamenense]SEJ46951.1 indole-3-glycerol phosphate synthase [Cyclobacterium xiamenense]